MVRLPLGGAGAGGVRGGRDENKGSESSIHHGYVTHETSVSVVILTIDSPLHPSGASPAGGRGTNPRPSAADPSLPYHPLRGSFPEGKPSCETFAAFVPRICSPISLIHALQRLTTFSPASPVPFHPRKGGDRQHDLGLYHLSFTTIVQFPLTGCAGAPRDDFAFKLIFALYDRTAPPVAFGDSPPELRRGL